MRTSPAFVTALGLGLVGGAHLAVSVFVFGEETMVAGVRFNWLGSRYWWAAALVATVVSVVRREFARWFALGFGVLFVALIWVETVLSRLSAI